MKGRLFTLDILRFFAAFAVMLFHFSLVFYNKYKFYPVHDHTFNNISLYGDFGVQLFFVISGFVILMSAKHQSPKEFVKLRLIRLYPVYIPLCIFAYILELTVSHNERNITSGDLFLNMSMVGLFFTNKMVSNVYWTLKIEILFYVFIYLILKTKNIARIRIFLTSWLVLSIITYAGIHYSHFRIFNVARFLLITDHSYYFIGGCYFYLIKYERKPLDLIMPLLCMISACISISKPLQAKPVEMAVVAGIFVLMYLISLTKFNPSKNKFLYSSMGETTYPLYLIHSALGISILYPLTKFLPGTVSLFIAISVVILFSFLSFFFIEKPIRSWLKAQNGKTVSKVILSLIPHKI